MRRTWLRQPSAVGRAVTIPLTGVAFYLLHRWGGIASIPLWQLYLILGFAGLASVLAERRWPAHCTRRQLHARVAIDIAATTAVIYAIGWGPTLAIGYVFVVANEFRKHGSRVWHPALVWTVIGIGLGEAAIALGIAPTIIHEPQVHGLALLSVLGPERTVRSILSRDLTTLSSVSGIGRKKAERLVLELQDRFGDIVIERHVEPV